MTVKCYSIPSIEDFSGNLFYFDKGSIPEVRPDVKRRKYERLKQLFFNLLENTLHGEIRAVNGNSGGLRVEVELPLV